MNHNISENLDEFFNNVYSKNLCKKMNNNITENLNEFFNNASPEELEDINKAFNIQIPGDVTLEEYLENFNDQYFYTNL